MKKKLCVIGLGYIGLPNAAIFAENGYEVIGVDIDESLIKSLNDGNIHTKEPGLTELVQQMVSEGKLYATDRPQKADYFIIAVPTPSDEEGNAILTYVEKAAQSLVAVLQKGNTVVIESTIPPRTTRDVIAPILAQSKLAIGDEVFLAHCPERVLPGRVLIELYENGRTVGGINSASAANAAGLYDGLTKGSIKQTTAENAEMSKLMENTYRSVNIALANELTKISEPLAVNPLEVIALANEHPRVNIHQPGPGVGGHCIAVDPYFIIEKAKEESVLIQQAMEINESMPHFVVKQVKKLVRPGGKVAVFGLAYKGNIDDVRDSPALKIATLLEEEGYELGVHDPYVRQSSVKQKLVSDEDAVSKASLLLILTDHKEFKQMNWSTIKDVMIQPNVLDTKHCVENDISTMHYYSYENVYEI